MCGYDPSMPMETDEKYAGRKYDSFFLLPIRTRGRRLRDEAARPRRETAQYDSLTYVALDRNSVHAEIHANFRINIYSHHEKIRVAVHPISNIYSPCRQ